MKNERWYHKQFPKDKFPQLYSKRGFEKSRIKISIPKKRNKLAKVYLSSPEKIFKVDDINKALKKIVNLCIP